MQWMIIVFHRVPSDSFSFAGVFSLVIFEIIARINTLVFIGVRWGKNAHQIIPIFLNIYVA